MSKFIIVDESDNIIGAKERSEILPEDIYRVSGLMLANSNDEVLIARRAYTKSHDPGKWGPAVAGTVEEGETYEQNIIKEAEEELGLVNIKPIPGPKIFRNAEHRYFAQWFILKMDKPIREFKVQEVEVAEIKWIKIEELIDAIQNQHQDFLAGAPQWLDIVKSLKDE